MGDGGTQQPDRAVRWVRSLSLLPEVQFGFLETDRSLAQELPGHQGYLDFAVEVGAELPPRARELLSERARILSDAP